jgi:hypothetical protein
MVTWRNTPFQVAEALAAWQAETYDPEDACVPLKDSVAATRGQVEFTQTLALALATELVSKRAMRGRSDLDVQMFVWNDLKDLEAKEDDEEDVAFTQPTPCQLQFVGAYAVRAGSPGPPCVQTAGRSWGWVMVDNPAAAAFPLDTLQRYTGRGTPRWAALPLQCPKLLPGDNVVAHALRYAPSWPLCLVTTGLSAAKLKGVPPIAIERVLNTDPMFAARNEPYGEFVNNPKAFVSASPLFVAL